MKHLITLKSSRIHEIMFYMFLMVLPWQTRILYWPNLAYISWYFNYHLAFFLYLSDVLLFGCVVSWLVFDKPRFVWKDWLILAILLVLWVISSLFHVKHVAIGIYETLKWLEFVALLIYVGFTFRTPLKFRISAWLLYLGAVIQSIIGILQFHVKHSLGIGDYIAPFGTPGLATIDSVAGKVIRAYGTMPHPNILGAFLVLGLALGIYLVSRETKYRFWLALGLIPLTLGLFLTFSRTAWLGAAIVLLGTLVYSLKKRQRTIALIMISMVLSLGLILGFYRTTLNARITASDSRSITDRNFFNQNATTLIRLHPVFGVGVGNYVPVLRQTANLEPWQYQPPHNIFLMIAAELGIVGLLLFVAILAQILYDLKSLSFGNLEFTILLISLVFMFMGLFDHYFVTIQQGRLLFFTVLGCLAALPYVSYEKLS